METRLTSRGREVVISGDRPFVIIGERINPTGRKVLAAEMKDGVMDRVRSDAQAQTAAGAHMLDVNAGIPAIDEPALLVAAIKAVMEVTDIPICIDSSIIEAIAMTVAADPTCGLITLETMRLIRDKLGNNMTCGASNVSFGLPDRPAVNAAFLPLAMHAGLTCAITNPLEGQVRRAILAGDLLLGHDEYAMRWISNFRADQAAKSAT